MIYGGKIVQDFKEGKLDSEGNPLEPSPMERLSSEEVCKKTSSQAPSYASLSPKLLPTHLLADGGEV